MTPTQTTQIEEIEKADTSTTASVSHKCMLFIKSHKKLLYRSILVAITLGVIAIILKYPLATNDGPVHTAFSHLILTYQQPFHPLQQQAYTLNLKPNPNLAVYFLMAALMRFLSPGLTESLIQILCLVGPVVAGYFAFRAITPRNAWLSIFILPMTLNQMFFLGLYNHAISMGAFFLVIGIYFWMLKAPSYLRAAALAAAFILTFFCHASGFIMSYTGIGMMTLVSAILSFRRMLQATPSFGAALLPVLKKHSYTVAAMFAPIPVGALFVSSGGKNPVEFGIPIRDRLFQFTELHTLAVNYPLRDRFPAFAISALLLCGFLIVAVRIFRSHPDWTPQRRDQAIGTIAATLLAVFIMAIFPDTMGGGWTHYRRFQVYPYFWILLTLAFESFSTRLAGIYFAVGASASLVLISSTVGRQATIHNQMIPLIQADQLIGNHCSVLPLVLESHIVGPTKIPEWMDYQPYFQSASRLELTGDRVVLFNYLARLTPYPVHFRPEIEPQANIFRWKPQQISNEIEKVDLTDFENGSSIKVDYILLWGTPSRRKPDMQRQISSALIHFDRIYQSSDQWVTLYRRHSGLNSACTANAPASDLASIH